MAKAKKLSLLELATLELRKAKLGMPMFAKLIFPNSLEVHYRVDGEWQFELFGPEDKEDNYSLVSRVLAFFEPVRVLAFFEPVPAPVKKEKKAAPVKKEKKAAPAKKKKKKKKK